MRLYDAAALEEEVRAYGTRTKLFEPLRGSGSGPITSGYGGEVGPTEGVQAEDCEIHCRAQEAEWDGQEVMVCHHKL